MAQEQTKEREQIIAIAAPLIAEFEGLGPNVDSHTGHIKPYVCPAGKVTAGHGHVVLPTEAGKFFQGASIEHAKAMLISASHGKPEGKKWLETLKPMTPELVQEIFVTDLTVRLKEIEACVKVPSTAGQMAAMLSLLFNIGAGSHSPFVSGFRTSSVLHFHNCGQPVQAAHAFDMWDKATVNGVLQVLAGLKRRRDCEAFIYSGGTIAQLISMKWVVTHG